MKIGQKFNQLTQKEYFFYIDNYKKYTDFNTLGLYRSILENEKLSLEEKIAVREYAHKTFQKFFNFLQLKDPDTFIKVSTLGQILTCADERHLWNLISVNQEKILKDKKIKHRNFGIYAKHNCGHDPNECGFSGLMIKQGSWWAESEMCFATDKRKYYFIEKSRKYKQEKRKMNQTIQKIIAE